MDLSKTFQRIKAYADSRSLPLIPFCSKNVAILRDPSSFYDFLLLKSREARRRVALSSLYLGTGNKERALVQALCNNLISNSKLNVLISLDFNRARRADTHGNSSVATLHSLLAHDNVTLNLIKSNLSTSIAQRVLSRFNRWNELSSTYHSKLLVFDDDVMLTGANLSSIYFENRKDRYLSIRDSKLLSDYIYGLLEKLNAPAQSFKKIIETHNTGWLRQLDGGTDNEKMDSYILPLCQHGPSGVQNCDDFIKFLDTTIPQNARMHMSSGYFNPRLDLRLHSVLAPSERSNGFYNGSGLLSYVPRIYTALLAKFGNRNPSCAISLYEKPNWSYHAKGLWIDGLEDLTLHMIGSSNFNWRSSARDFEMQFVIITRNKSLEEALVRERDELWAESRPLRQEDLDRLNPVYKAVAYLVKSLL